MPPVRRSWGWAAHGRGVGPGGSGSARRWQRLRGRTGAVRRRWGGRRRRGVGRRRSGAVTRGSGKRRIGGHARRPAGASNCARPSGVAAVSSGTGVRPCCGMTDPCARSPPKIACSPICSTDAPSPTEQHRCPCRPGSAAVRGLRLRMQRAHAVGGRAARGIASRSCGLPLSTISRMAPASMRRADHPAPKLDATLRARSSGLQMNSRTPPCRPRRRSPRPRPARRSLRR